jgi:hypothetical protein
MTKQQAYEALSKNHYHWDRVDSKHIVVWTSGYKADRYWDVVELLTSAKFMQMTSDWDPHSCMTRSVFKHK